MKGERWEAGTAALQRVPIILCAPLTQTDLVVRRKRASASDKVCKDVDPSASFQCDVWKRFGCQEMRKDDGQTENDVPTQPDDNS